MSAARILARWRNLKDGAPAFGRENRAAPGISCACAGMMQKRRTPAPTRDSISCGICAFVHCGDGYGIALCRGRPLEGSSAGMQLDGRHAGAEFVRYGALQSGNRTNASQHAAIHSTTRSAIVSRAGGISIASAFVVLRLITSWNFVGCSIGKSAGLAPFNILLTRTAAVRKTSS